MKHLIFPDFLENFWVFSNVQNFVPGKFGYAIYDFCAQVFRNLFFGIDQISKYGLSLLNLDLLKKGLAFLANFQLAPWEKLARVMPN